MRDTITTTTPNPKIIDKEILTQAARCLRARAEARLTWARNDERDLFGTLDALPSPAESLEEARYALECLTQLRPETVGGVEAILKVVLDILTERETRPDLALSEGPVLALIRQVLEGLDYCYASDVRMTDLRGEAGHAEPELALAAD
jgi:NAD(P)H-dependent FMN reductase